MCIPDIINPLNMVANLGHPNQMLSVQIYSILWSSLFLSFVNITTGFDPYSKLCSAGEFTRICIPLDYMKFELPSTDEPTIVTIGVDIKAIPKVKDKDFSITLNAYFMAQWRDTRLEINERNTSRRVSRATEDNDTSPHLIPVNPEVFSKRLWLPDVG